MGFHKTASSSFQSTCEANLEELSSQGYLYPAFYYHGLRNGRNFYNHSGPIFSLFSDTPYAYGFNIKEKVKNITEANNQYKNQLENFLSLDKDLILSGEGLSALPEQSLANLYKYLRDSGSVIIPIVCVRSPYEFHCSSAQTVVKHGRYINLSRLRSQKETILKVKRVFKDEINFISFNIACKHPKGPTAYMLEHFGINIDSLSFITKNERRSNEYVRLQNALNKKQPSLLDNKINKNHLKIHEVEGEKFLLNDIELGIIKEKLNKENEFFSKVLGRDFCDEEIITSKILTTEDLVDTYPDFFHNKLNKLAYKFCHSKIGIFSKTFIVKKITH